MRSTLIRLIDAAFGFPLGHFLVPTPAAAYAVMAVISQWLFLRRSKSLGASPRLRLGLCFVTTLAAILGARLLYVLIHLSAQPLSITSLAGHRYGTISWGAYLGGGVVMLSFALWRGTAGWRMADCAASCLGLSEAIGRTACLLSGDDFGKLSRLPWAVTFPIGTPAYAHQVRLGMLGPAAPESLPVHPLQLYLSLNGLILFAIFSRKWPKSTTRPGTIFFGYGLAFSASRLCLDFLRGERSTLAGLGLSTTQLISISVFILSLLALTQRRSRPVGMLPIR